MITEALNKLNKRQMDYLKTLSAIIARARKNGLKAELENRSGKLRGFLECLCQMEIISGYEVQILYTYFAEKDRSDHRVKKIFNI